MNKRQKTKGPIEVFRLTEKMEQKKLLPRRENLPAMEALKARSAVQGRKNVYTREIAEALEKVSNAIREEALRS